MTIAENIADSAILAVDGCFPDSVVGFIPTVPGDELFVKYLPDVEQSRRTGAARGTTQDNLSLSKIEIWRVSVPAVDGRRRIAEVLSAFDELIEINERRIELLEDLARSAVAYQLNTRLMPNSDAQSHFGPLRAHQANKKLPDYQGVLKSG